MDMDNNRSSHVSYIKNYHQQNAPDRNGNSFCSIVVQINVA